MSMKKKYEIPEVTVIEVMVEKGFAASYDDVEIGDGTGYPD